MVQRIFFTKVEAVILCTLPGSLCNSRVLLVLMDFGTTEVFQRFLPMLRFTVVVDLMKTIMMPLSAEGQGEGKQFGGIALRVIGPMCAKCARLDPR